MDVCRSPIIELGVVYEICEGETLALTIRRIIALFSEPKPGRKQQLSTAETCTCGFPNIAVLVGLFAWYVVPGNDDFSCN